MRSLSIICDRLLEGGIPHKRFDPRDFMEGVEMEVQIGAEKRPATLLEQMSFDASVRALRALVQLADDVLSRERIRTEDIGRFIEECQAVNIDTVDRYRTSIAFAVLEYLCNALSDAVKEETHGTSEQIELPAKDLAEFEKWKADHGPEEQEQDDPIEYCVTEYVRQKFAGLFALAMS